MGQALLGGMKTSFEINFPIFYKLEFFYFSSFILIEIS
jgi:hypothetical protein